VSGPSDLGSVDERICGISLGGIYRRKQDGAIFKVVTIAEHPTMTLERIDADGSEIAGAERVGGVIGAPIFADFVELVDRADS
jgi:hypothetical protein